MLLEGVVARNTEGGVRVPGVGGSGRDARLRAEDDLDVVGLRLQSRGSSRDSLWAHSLGDRRRRAPVVLSTLPPALVARLLIAPARVGSASAAHPCSGRQALQLGRAARAAVGSAQPHVLFLGRLARLAVELRRESSAQAGHDGAATSGVEATAIDGSRRLACDKPKKIEHNCVTVSWPGVSTPNDLTFGLSKVLIDNSPQSHTQLPWCGRRGGTVHHAQPPGGVCACGRT